jgi:4-amino-4-deoxy-L-arabinose transferase-like glycosyltransferase
LAGTATVEPQTRPVRRRKARGTRGIRAIVARVRPIEAEALLLLALFGFALIMRWPNLLRLPHFTDEIGEIRYLLQIYRGESFPLTAQVKYFGPVHHYLVALCFWLFGPSIALPRAIVCVIGALTVATTYLIGRELGGWRLGLLGGALLATLPQHIVVNSHVAWANSTTPFYATICFYAILRAIRALPTSASAGASPPGRRSRAAGGWLLLCGLVFGLMLQTHVGTVVLAPAIGGTFLFALRRTRSWRILRTPWPSLAPLLTLLAYSPVIIDNARGGFAGYYRARGRDYAFVADPSTDTYLHNLRNLLYEVARMISNPFRTPARMLDYFTSPYMLIAVALALLGSILLARRGQILPALVTLVTALAMPYFNHAYGVDGDRYLVTGRYIAFLLPLLTIAIGAGAIALATLALRAIPRRSPHGVPLRTVAAVVPVILMLALILYPIIPLRRYYTHESGLDPDNASFLDTVAFVDSVRGTRAPVLIGPLFYKVDLKDGADARDILDVLLTLDGIPHRVLQDPRVELPQLAAGIDPRDVEAQPIVIMMRDECFPIREGVPLLRLSGRYRLRELYWTAPSYYGVYRYTPGLAPGASCLPAGGPTPGD